MTAFYKDSLLIPLYATGLSFAIFCADAVYLSKRAQDSGPTLSRETDADGPLLGNAPASISAKIRAHAHFHGGMVIFGFQIARTVGCVVLLSLNVAYLVLREIDDNAHNPPQRLFALGHFALQQQDSWHIFSLSVTYHYITIVALLYLSSKPLGASPTGTGRIKKTFPYHLSCILLTTLAVFCWRDVWPLCTYTLRPLDLPTDNVNPSYAAPILWAQVAILVIIGVLIPLLRPRVSVPLSKDPNQGPDPEETCSIVSLVTYSFLDPWIFKAYRQPHLEFDELPALADRNSAAYLREKTFSRLDSFHSESKLDKSGHIFFRLFGLFLPELGLMTLMVLLASAMDFVAPIGVNRLLNYFETNGEDKFIRPWVWVLWLFFGPFIRTLANNWYYWLSSTWLIQFESVITQLVFEHGLRVRMRAEPSQDTTSPAVQTDSTSTPSTPAGTSTTSPEAHSTGSSVQDSARESSFSSKFTALARAWAFIRCRVRRKEKSAQKSQSTKNARPNSEGPTNTQARMTNLITSDLESLGDLRHAILFLVPVPLEAGLAVWFLYSILGWSAFVGMSAILILYPVPGYIGRLLHHFQKDRMSRTDARVQSVTETMNLVRMIKIFGWEREMNTRISEKREAELAFLRKRKMLELISTLVNHAVPLIIMMASYTTYSMTVFNILEQRLYVLQYGINVCITGKVSLDRLDEFLKKSELLDHFSTRPFSRRGVPVSATANGQDRERYDADGTTDLSRSNTSTIMVPDLPLIQPPAGYDDVIGFHDASFTWSVADTESQTSSTATSGNGAEAPAIPVKRNFALNIEGELLFRRGCMNLIVGPTGSGKTSLLMALLGEMHFVPKSLDSWYQLPRSGGISYASQESWVQNETIRDNILFGSPYNEDRYTKVIRQCCLERDIGMFEAGDMTEVGEKGITLSGGQKARVTLARAVYSRTETILLDDVLAALDVHTAKWIVDKCFSGDLLKGRTVILVTHNIALAKPIASFIVSMGANGRIASHGSVSEVLKEDKALAREVMEEEKAIAKEEAGQVNEPKAESPEAGSAGKLVIKEEVKLGHVGWQAWKVYFSALGGNHPLAFFTGYYGLCVIVAILLVGQTWYLGYWSAQYENHSSRDVPVAHYLSVYGLLLLSVMITMSLQEVILIFGSMAASRSLHQQLIHAMLGTTWRWLDTTPISRIITRCTQDISAIDSNVPGRFSTLSDVSLDVIIKFSAVVLFVPAFLGPGIVLLLLGGWCGRIYIAAQLSVKRESSNAKAPVLGHFGAATAGLVSIRAYGAQDSSRKEAQIRIDRYTRTMRPFYNLNRWVAVRTDFLGSLFVAGLAIYLLYGGRLSSANTGFTLNMAVGFSSVIMFLVRVMNEFELQGNSLERIQGYLSVDQEPKPVVQRKPPAYWPSSGKIVVEKLSARYSADGPKVLQDISFYIKSGERVGVVGRTGSGKSSLTLSLLRCIPTEGNVYFDGIPTDSINLEDLRSNVTLIPQVPELLSGTLRRNIDPFGQHDDATLNDALRAAGLFSLQSETDEDKITLDTSIATGGGNLSVGQRQILALARAMVRRSKLLILDEATSAIDYKTDAVIQSSLRNELSDVTSIIIAHRLQTIMDADKIMVLDAGRLVEFDTPQQLLEKENGMFRALVDESGDRDALIAMVEAR
ncbi:hypothetical protein HGRIS_007445 [Hohenbuehelia grisea]|uniref:P-loop containing nucleoside triphosphate hydrolase protein n=1 Tax=Hohenbuehelia grisea TaxID=104357 RepID=A0ABR3J4T9_9AGAR